MTSKNTHYASTTSVPVHRTRADIEKALERYGAHSFASATIPGKGMIEFATDTRRVRFVIPMPDPQDPEFTRTPTGRPRSADAIRQAVAQAERQRWRALLLLVKAELEAIAAGIITFEQAFMAQTVLPSGRTVSDELSGQIESAYLESRVAPLQIQS